MRPDHYMLWNIDLSVGHCSDPMGMTIIRALGTVTKQIDTEICLFIIRH